MSDIAIRVENLSKQYHIGGPQARYKTIRESLTKAVQAPFRRLASVVRGQSSAVSNETIWALKDVSFEVKRGEVVGIIGRNGAGKSTLLKILSRITEPTEGRAEIHGRVGSLLEVGTGFHPELTGRENISLNGAILGMKRAEIERKFDEIVAFAEIEKFIDTPVKHYSSGMHVRLAFAVAAHLEPEILLVDEVLAVGDTAFQKKCLGKMGDVARGGRTVLFVSHNMAAVENLCQRGVVLDQGQATFIGSQSEAIAQYLKRLDTNTSSLRERRDRVGSGKLRILAVDVRGPDGKRLDVLTSGQDVNIHLYYEVTGDIPKTEILAGIQVMSQFGSKVFFHHNRLTKELFAELPPKGVFVCRIKRLPLVPGIYRLRYVIMANAGHGGEYLDSMEDAARLTVVEGDFYGSGEVPLSSHALCLVDANWWVASFVAPSGPTESTQQY